MSDSPYLVREVWEQTIKGWLITDCVIREKGALYFCLREKVSADEASMMFDHDVKSRLFVLSLTEAQGTRYGARTLQGFNHPRVGAATLPKPQGLLSARNSDGQVSVIGGGGKFPDEFIAPGAWPMTYRMKTLDGYAYSVGGGRSIYKRTDIGLWTPLREGLPDVDVDTSQGFNDLDAFSPSDMYAVGGHGDVWHFDGQRWEQQGFPSNVQLSTVTCAGDGKVYISGEGGSLWVGEKSTWKRLYEGHSSILWNDALWFEGELWLASDYQLRVWRDGEMSLVMDGDRQVPAYGHMDARDGLLVVATPDSVWGFDGRAWRSLIAPYLD